MSINSGILVPPGGGMNVNGNEVPSLNVGFALNFDANNDTINWGESSVIYGNNYRNTTIPVNRGDLINFGFTRISRGNGSSTGALDLNRFAMRPYKDSGTFEILLTTYGRDKSDIQVRGRSIVSSWGPNIFLNSDIFAGYSRIVSYNLQLMTQTSSNGQRTVTLGNAATEPTAGITDGIVWWSAPAIDATNTAAPHFLSEDAKEVILYPFVSFGTPTGTKTTSTFDTATVTVSELAERVYALIDALELTGLIETT